MGRPIRAEAVRQWKASSGFNVVEGNGVNGGGTERIMCRARLVQSTLSGATFCPFLLFQF